MSFELNLITDSEKNRGTRSQRPTGELLAQPEAESSLGLPAFLPAHGAVLGTSSLVCIRNGKILQERDFMQDEERVGVGMEKWISGGE